MTAGRISLGFNYLIIEMEFFCDFLYWFAIARQQLWSESHLEGKTTKSVGPISQMGGQEKAAVQLRPGPRERMSLNAVPQ